MAARHCGNTDPLEGVWVVSGSELISRYFLHPVTIETVSVMVRIYNRLRFIVTIFRLETEFYAGAIGPWRWYGAIIDPGATISFCIR